MWLLMASRCARKDCTKTAASPTVFLSVAGSKSALMLIHSSPFLSSQPPLCQLALIFTPTHLCRVTQLHFQSCLISHHHSASLHSPLPLSVCACHSSVLRHTATSPFLSSDHHHSASLHSSLPPPICAASRSYIANPV